VIWVFSMINRHLTRHMPSERQRIRYRPQLIR
jgi:hypothetical protein